MYFSHPITSLQIFPFSSFIYSTDLDGAHVKVKCSRRCTVGFHPGCYRMMKKPKTCTTPDCDGIIVNVVDHH